MIEKWPAKRIEDIQDFWKRLKNEMRQLDKVLISRVWEQKYLMVRVSTLTRIDSDHNPLLLDTRSNKKMMGFRFEPAWLTQLV
jgi:endonuclease/exonuclease/phosphatase family metal-dependent hydrolase